MRVGSSSLFNAVLRDLARIWPTMVPWERSGIPTLSIEGVWKRSRCLWRCVAGIAGENVTSMISSSWYGAGRRSPIMPVRLWPMSLPNGGYDFISLTRSCSGCVSGCYVVAIYLILDLHIYLTSR